MKLSELPDRMVRLISKGDRKSLGLKTRDEAIAAAEIKTERELHKQVGGLLRFRDVCYFSSRMDKRTTTQRGMPDFIFSIAHKPNYNGSTASLLTWPLACAWELKLPGKKLDAEQQKMFDAMQTSPNSWQCRVISSVDQALAELKRLGVP